MKYALIIGNNRYTDQKMAQLKTPAADSQALAKVLVDANIGSFDEVTPLINRTESQVSRAISAFLANKKPEDLVLLYFSGHGVLDDRGRLFLALKDTQTGLLKSTAISASFIADEMDSCRSKRQILILDCCHSGAFERGTKGQEQTAVNATTFEGTGFGRVVLTASASTQYALEGDQVIEQSELSLFTHFLLEGLETGKADVNNDGYISLDEWYDYTYSQVLSTTPKQVPHKWSYHQQGDLLIAKNPFLKKKSLELPEDLIRLLESPYSSVRGAAVKELGVLLHSRSTEYWDLARAALEKLAQDDSRTVSQAALSQLQELEKPARDRQAAEQIARDQAAREMAARVEQQRAEQVEREKLARELAEKAKREKAERQAAQLAASKEALSKSFTALRQDLPKAMPFFGIAGMLGIIFILVLAGIFFVPRLFSLLPNLKATSTPTFTITATNTPFPSETPKATDTATATITFTPSEPFSYVVQEGDSLESIAQKFNLGPDGSLLIYYANQKEIEANGGVYFVGQTFIIPPPGSKLPTLTPIPANLPRGTIVEYSVIPGDTLAGIAARFNSNTDAIIRENNITDANGLMVGQVLKIPVNLVTPTATLPPTSTRIKPSSTPTVTPSRTPSPTSTVTPF